MRLLNPMRSRRRAIDELRVAVSRLPRATRIAMLHGLEHNPIIVGAYANADGICPMLAAHRAGGRTSFIGFAEAWDRFAQRGGRYRRPRRATERELLVLRSHLRASLLADEHDSGVLAAAIADHRALVASRPAAQPRPGRAARPAAQPRPGHAATARGKRSRPGDADRSRELRGVRGWAWSRLFRGYDDYARAMHELSDASERTLASPLGAA
jgi:hypothetical protein